MTFIRFAVAVLVSALAIARAEACSLTMPASATSGTYFTITWSLTGPNQLPATIDRTNQDGSTTTIATVNTFSGSTTAWATNVLGTRTFTLNMANGNHCGATIAFTFNPPQTSCYKIIISGIAQSNESGHTAGPFIDPLQGQGYDQSIFQVGRWGASNMQLVPIGYAQNGVKFDGLQHWSRPEQSEYIGHVLTMARLIAQNNLEPGCIIVIVPVARGSVSIEQWFAETPDLPLYSDMLARINYVLSLPGTHQFLFANIDIGETDILRSLAGDPGMNAQIFYTELVAVAQRLRTDLAVPDLQFIIHSFSQHWLADDPDAVVQKKAYLTSLRNAGTTLAQAALVGSSDLLSDWQIGYPGGDNHFCAQSQVDYGERDYDAWAALNGFSAKRKAGNIPQHGYPLNRSRR